MALLDKVFKQRMVGALVLVALAVIFLPMLFSRQDEQRQIQVDAPTAPQIPVMQPVQVEPVAVPEPQVIAQERNIYKGVSANVDFYSGFVYKMLGLPEELYTPLFAIARIVGWSAHRMEEMLNMNKIIRPAYESVLTTKKYTKLKDRNA